MTIQPSFGTIPAFTVADRLRKARETAGLDQTQMAVELGVSRGTISNAERGNTRVKKTLLLAWSMRTGVPSMWLETGEAPSPSGDGASELCTPRDSNPEPIDLRSVRLARLAVAA